MRKTHFIVLATIGLYMVGACGSGTELPGSSAIPTPDTRPLPDNSAMQTTATQAVGDVSKTSFREPAAAPALPSTEVENATAVTGSLAPVDAFRLLEQATFGPTTEDIIQLSSIGSEAWIDQQLQHPARFLSDGLQQVGDERWNEYVNVWWRHAIEAEDQLRQRVAFALSQILVVAASAGLGDEQFGLSNYYDILLRHAFGNYRDLLEAITLNPVMGEYLSMKGNHKPVPEENIQPDENYARELLQLFSIGQVLLHPDGTPQLDGDGVPLPAYDQSVIANYARAFTGWHFANADDFRWPSDSDYISPMRAFDDYHDPDSKQLLLGRSTPAGNTARQDLDAALDSIFEHPNVGPFIARQLIQRLVTSNPSPEYVRDVATVFNRNHAGERGALGSTIKAILMHNEARHGHLNAPANYGKLKEPLLRVTQLWRAFKPTDIPKNFNYSWAKDELEQAPLNAPSVFNFFRPDYSQPGSIRNSNLVSPEFQIINETSIVSITSRMLANTIWSHNYKHESNEHQLAIDISDEMALETDPNALLDHLNLLMLGGRMSDGLRNEVQSLMAARDYPNAASQRVVEAIFLIASSPEAALQF